MKPPPFLKNGVPAEGVIEWARYLLARAREQDEDSTPPEIRGLPIDQKRKWKEWRKLKYRLKKSNPEGWKREWREQILPELKAEEKGRPVFRRPGRPKRAGPWWAVWLLRAYFAFEQEAAARIQEAEAAPTKRPPGWALLAELLNAAERKRKWTAATLRAGWHKQKHRFDNWDGEACLWGECSLAIRQIIWCDEHGIPCGSQAFRNVLADFVGEFFSMDKSYAMLLGAYERFLAKGSPPPSPWGDPSVPAVGHSPSSSSRTSSTRSSTSAQDSVPLSSAAGLPDSA